jgi:hypothetical protein
VELETKHRHNSGNVGYRSVQNLLGDVWSSGYARENLSLIFRTNLGLLRRHDVEKIFAPEGQTVKGVFRNMQTEDRGDL